VVAAAFQATRGAHTARVQIRIQVTAGSSGSSLNASTTADGVLDFANGTQDLTTRQPTGGTLETRTVGGATYTQLPAAVAGRPGTKPWLKVVVPPGLKRPSSFYDPTQVLGLLRGAASSVTTVGKETVRRERTTHYKVQIDLTKLQAEAGRTAASGQPNPYSLLRKLLGRDTLPMDVWVDSQQRIARLRTVLPLPSSASAATAPTAAPAPSPSPTPAGTATSIEEFYDFGVPVNVQAPPAGPGADRRNRRPARCRSQPTGPKAAGPQRTQRPRRHGQPRHVLSRSQLPPPNEHRGGSAAAPRYQGTRRGLPLERWRRMSPGAPSAMVAAHGFRPGRQPDDFWTRLSWSTPRPIACRKPNLKPVARGMNDYRSGISYRSARSLAAGASGRPASEAGQLCWP